MSDKRNPVGVYTTQQGMLCSIEYTMGDQNPTAPLRPNPNSIAEATS